MKTKIKLNKFFAGLFFAGLYLAVNISHVAADTQTDTANCIASGGSGLSIVGNCQNCPTGKVSNNGVCVDPTITGPSTLPDATVGDFYGNPITTPVAVIPKASTKFDYKLLESFPGFYNADQTLIDLPGLVLSIYKFGIWTVGIAGLFMIVIGGIMYMSSAGNTSNASSAQGIIKDALIGIVAAMGAYLVLYVINPDFTKINLSFTSVGVREAEDAEVNGSTSTTLVTRDGVQMDSSFANSLEKIKNNGIRSVATSGLRSLEKQKQLIVQNCGGYPATRACSPPTCLLRNGSSDSCPHTTGRAVDIWALNSSGSQAITQARCQTNISACFNDPYQKALVAAMRAEGFCVLASEPWHFEKPKMSSACN